MASKRKRGLARAGAVLSWAELEAAGAQGMPDMS